MEIMIMCNSYYLLDELIDIQYGSNSFGDLQQVMMIRKRQLDEKLMHLPLKEETEWNKEYAKNVEIFKKSQMKQ